MRESDFADLEGKMHALAAAGEYEKAAAFRDQLSNAQVDDEAHVLRVNTEFYEAIAERDVGRLKAVWLEANFVQCIHPGEQRSVGYTSVIDSCQRLLGSAKFKVPSITVEEVRISIRGASAIVTCLEQFVIKPQRRPARTMFATNVFRKVGSQWRLTHRHVSLASDIAGGMSIEDPILGMMHGPEAWQMAKALANLPGARLVVQQGILSRNRKMEDGDHSDGDSEMSVQELEEQMQLQPELPGADDESGEEELDEKGGEAEAARDTVRALRRLSKEERLSNQARIQLLSEMIRTPGTSMPERAHELLLHNVLEEEKKAAWDDFAQLIAMEARRLDAAPKAKEAKEGKQEKQETPEQVKVQHRKGSTRKPQGLSGSHQ